MDSRSHLSDVSHQTKKARFSDENSNPSTLDAFVSAKSTSTSLVAGDQTLLRESSGLSIISTSCGRPSSEKNVSSSDLSIDHELGLDLAESRDGDDGEFLPPGDPVIAEGNIRPDDDDDAPMVMEFTEEQLDEMSYRDYSVRPYPIIITIPY